MLVTFFFLTPSTLQAVVQQVPASSKQNSNALMNVLAFFLEIIIATVILLVIFRIYHGSAFYAIIEGVVVVSASFYLFLIVLGSLFPTNAELPYVVAASLAIPILLLVAKYKRPELRNAIAIMASIGAGIVLGQVLFPLYVAIVFMAIIAIYDYISVFVTRHMLTLGREAVNRNMALMIGSSDIELVPKSYLSKKSLEEFKKYFKLSRVKNEELKKEIRKGTVPIPTQAALGTGDLAIPLMVAVSAYIQFATVPFGRPYFVSGLIIVGATIGLVFTMEILKTYKIALPAIPPLFSFISIALSFFYFLSGSALAGIGLLLIGVSIIGIMLVTVRKISNQQGRNVF